MTDLSELAGLGVDVAHLAVPPTCTCLTRRCSSRASASSPKPISLGTDDARELAELAAKGLALGVNHNNVFHPSFTRMVKRIESGEIGRVEHVRVTLSVPLRQLDAGDYSHWMFRAPHNIVFEQAVHPLSQLEHLLGPVKSATVDQLQTTELHPGQTFIKRWSASFNAERGTAGLYMAFGEPFTRSTIQVLGSDGSLEADLFHDQLSGEQKTLWLDFWNSYRGRERAKQTRQDARQVLKNWSMFTLGLGARKDAFFVGMKESIQAFHRALRAGEPLPNDAWAARGSPSGRRPRGRHLGRAAPCPSSPRR